MDDSRKHDWDEGMSDAVADAWAEVIISILERVEAECTNSSTRPGAQVAA